MVKIAFVVGMAANLFYFAGYLMKTRNKIIVLNATSRVLYILQYFILGALEGAILETAAIVASLVAKGKDKSVVKKHLPLFIIGVNVMLIAAGLVTYKNVFSILPLIGVLMHTGAFWLNNEKYIRIISIIGQPFWLVYNFVSQAYSSCLGDVIAICAMAIAIVMYDIIPKFKRDKTEVL